MAKQHDGQDPSFKAKDDMSSSQFRFAKIDGTTDDQVDICDGTADLMIGVLQDTGVTGQGVIIRVYGHTKIVLGTTITAGQLLGTDNAGRATPLTPATTEYVAGICTVGGAVNEIGEMILQSRGRAA